MVLLLQFARCGSGDCQVPGPPGSSGFHQRLLVSHSNNQQGAAVGKLKRNEAPSFLSFETTFLSGSPRRFDYINKNESGN